MGSEEITQTCDGEIEENRKDTGGWKRWLFSFFLFSFLPLKRGRRSFFTSSLVIPRMFFIVFIIYIHGPFANVSRMPSDHLGAIGFHIASKRDIVSNSTCPFLLIFFFCSAAAFV